MKRTTLLLALLASLYLPTSAMAADIAAPVQPPGADNFYRSPTVKGSASPSRTSTRWRWWVPFTALRACLAAAVPLPWWLDTRWAQ